MLSPASYTKAYIVDIDEFEDDITPAWEAEAPEAAQFLSEVIQSGALSKPGLYVIYANEEYNCIIRPLEIRG